MFDLIFRERKLIIFQHRKDVWHEEDQEDQFALLFEAWNGVEGDHQASEVLKKGVISKKSGSKMQSGSQKKQDGP